MLNKLARLKNNDAKRLEEDTDKAYKLIKKIVESNYLTSIIRSHDNKTFNLNSAGLHKQALLYACNRLNDELGSAIFIASLGQVFLVNCGKLNRLIDKQQDVE